MSSYICSSKHYNSVEDSLQTLFLFGRNYSAPYALKSLYPVLYQSRKQGDELVKEQIKSIVNTLRSLNVLCVSLQYKHHYAGKLDQEIEEQTKHVFEGKEYVHLTNRGLYHALRCTGYQIETEHLKELRSLTTDEQNALSFLEIMQNSLAHFIISELPEDASNRWSID